MSDPLDIESSDALLAYLRTTDRIGANESPRATNLAGGVSNRTVLLEQSGGESWVLKQSLERLRVQVDWRSDPRRIEREALGMQRLAEIAPAGTITPLIFLDPAHHLLAMWAVPQPHENWKTMLLSARPEPDHVRQFAELLGAIHRIGSERAGQFAREFEDTSFFESLRLEPYYQYSAQRMPFAAPFLERLIDQTRATKHTLVHGDFSPKNILVHEGRLVLLDHEVIHFGDGAFDLGFALTHLLSKANHRRELRQDFADAAKSFWMIYRRALGDMRSSPGLEERACRHTLACLLARCIGRSPLEYLTPPAAATQANAASSMMDAPPGSVPDLIDEFLRRIGKR
jgi:aminoglycoside phosphotransferase (APT) family kinase protein